MDDKKESSAEDKDHAPTPKKLEQMYEDGKILRSKDLTAGVTLFAGLLVLYYVLSELKVQFLENFRIIFSFIREASYHETLPVSALVSLLKHNFLIIFPILAITLAAAVISPFLYGGWLFNLNSLRFQLKFLNFFPNLMNIFTTKSLRSVGESFLKFAAIILTVGYYAYVHQNDFVLLFRLPFDEAISSSYILIVGYVLVLSLVLCAIISLDAGLQYYFFQQEAKMSTKELKDETKDSEGNPKVKGKIKQMQFQLSKQRLNILVPNATVIVTNPSHYAIAVKYNAKEDKAPKVIAKGKDFLASRIRQIAMTHMIPIYQAPYLARALYHTTRIGGEVDPELYIAVAIVLSYINQLKRYQHGFGPMPQYVSDLKIPETFIYDE